MNNLTHILIKPHVTEKATMSAEKSVYVFVVDQKSSKGQIEKAFVEKYKITPLKITTVTIPAKQVVVRGKRGTKSGYKKAYVYLPQGKKLESL